MTQSSLDGIVNTTTGLVQLAQTAHLLMKNVTLEEETGFADDKNFRFLQEVTARLAILLGDIAISLHRIADAQVAQATTASAFPQSPGPHSN